MDCLKDRSRRLLLVLCASLLAVLPSPTHAQNLLENAAFDFDGSNWEGESGTLLVLHRPTLGSDLTGGSGPGCVEVQNLYWNGSSAGPHQTVTGVSPGSTYLLEGSLQLRLADNVADSVSLVVDWHNQESFYLGSEWLTDDLPPANTWVRLSGTTTAPAGAATATVRLLVGNPHLTAETRPGVARFDDLWLEAVGTDTATQVLFVPVAASAHGAAGTFWSTTGWFASLVDHPVELSGTLLRQGRDNSSALAELIPVGVVQARGLLKVPDLVGALGGSETTAGIYLVAEADAGDLPPTLIRATTHTFTPSSTGGGVYGQGLPAVGAGERNRVVVPGLFQSDEQRTNVGALNTSGEELTLLLCVRDQAGSEVVSTTWSLHPYEQRQSSLPSLGVEALDGGSAELTRLSTVGSFRAYTSVVDQLSGDAVYNEGR